MIIYQAAASVLGVSVSIYCMSFFEGIESSIWEKEVFQMPLCRMLNITNVFPELDCLFHSQKRHHIEIYSGYWMFLHGSVLFPRT